MIAYLYVFAGGGVGSCLRFFLSQLTIQSTSYFWIGTLISNLLGTILYFVFRGSLQDDSLSPLLLIGFCGGLTTFSSFIYELVLLGDKGRIGEALTLLLLNMVLGVLIGVFMIGKKFV